MKHIHDKLVELLAFETLNYHNKNVLSGDNESSSRYLQSELKWLIVQVEQIGKEDKANGNELTTSSMPCEGLNFYRKSRQG